MPLARLPSVPFDLHDTNLRIRVLCMKRLIPGTRGTPFAGVSFALGSLDFSVIGWELRFLNLFA